MPRLPWPVPRAVPSRQPATFSQFVRLPKATLTPADLLYRRFFTLCHQPIKDAWLSNWVALYAVGPFVSREAPKGAIPFVLVANHTKPYRHIVRLGQALADAYVGISFFPQIHVVHPNTVAAWEESGHYGWARTKSASICWRQ